METQGKLYSGLWRPLRWIGLIVFFMLVLSACQKPLEKPVGTELSDETIYSDIFCIAA